MYRSAFFIFMIFSFILFIVGQIISGTISDSETGKPMPWVTVIIESLDKQTVSHQDGHFEFKNIPDGTYTLNFIYVGYQSKSLTISTSDFVDKNIEVVMTPTILRMKSVEVYAERYEESQSRSAEAVLSGKELRMQLGRTLAETLLNEPGLNQVSMGPAPARPVLRGLSGDRLMILENGNKTGDMSTTSPDHALAIDPINSERIEILRGPAALLYSSNSLGGVINVINSPFPTERKDHIHGTAGFQAETVNRGFSGNAGFDGNLGDFTWKISASGRFAQDISTPEGPLANTNVETFNGSIGFGLPKKWGIFGLSGSIFSTQYGLPGNFVGGHPDGIRINMYRRQAVAEVNVNNPFSMFQKMDADVAYSYYFHEELEFNPRSQQHDFVGAEYIVHTLNTNIRLQHKPISEGHRGTLAFWGEFRDFSAGGFTFTPQTQELSWAFINFHEFAFNKWNLQAAIRTDFRNTRPLRERESRLIGLIKERTFFDYSGSVKAKRTLSHWISTGVIALKTARIPAIEELFSEGPHLPAYSYEIGNPNLEIERGYGGEIFVHIDASKAHVKLSAFQNWVNDYMYPLFTGRESLRRPLPIYQTVGADVILKGYEASAEINILRNLVLEGTLSYVQGELIDERQPLPFIPPLTGKIDIQYRAPNWSFGAAMRSATSQNRLGEFEEPTDGFSIYNLFGEYSFVMGKNVHTLTFSAENILNETYRMHLSRVKSIMPEPGRNFKILYRAYF